MTRDDLGCPQLPPLRLSHQACVWSASEEQYRKLQQVAYMNHDGAGLWSTCALMVIYPMTVCFQMLIAEAAPRHLPAWFANLLAEFPSAVLPLAVGFSTPHTSWLAMANLGGVCAALFAVRAEGLAWLPLVMRMRATRVVRKEGVYSPSFTCIDAGKRRRFMAEYRAMVMITTCICILAVDFPSLFPRAHAKTEEYGYSLMDLGTGCVVCAGAICSRAARGATQGQRLAELRRRILALWPLLALGFARLVVLRGVDYHVPTSEYGVHWNFFFTIAVVALVSTVADLGPQASAVVGAILLGAYQLLLSLGGVAEYILHAPRTGLFSANREGILGCIGYLGIHWLSVGLGSLCALPAAQQDAHETARRLLLIAVAAIVATQVSDALGLPASHRMCNLPYATLVLGVDALGLGLLALVDLYWPWQRRPMPRVYGGVQDSMLAAFLAANLLTGAVNLATQPLLMPTWPALLVMLLYSYAWTAPLAYLHARGRTLKFW